jgi:hypothetical protein
MGKNKIVMKKIIFNICCLISISTLAQTPVEQVKQRLERVKEIGSFDGYFSVLYALYDYEKTISENELDTIFELQKEYYAITPDSYDEVVYGAKVVYNISKNSTLQRKALYFIAQAINDTLIESTDRGWISTLLVNDVNLQLFDRKMKDEIVKNLTFSYKNDYRIDHFMMNSNMILLAGALEMTELKDRLQMIADSTTYFDWKDAARVALCRMGDKKMLKEYFAELQSMRLQDVIGRWKEIEYIKQKESIDILLKILYSEETMPPVKETLPDDKFAWYAMQSIKRISANCPIDMENIHSYEQRDKCLAEMRRWARKNKIKINKNIW